MLASTPEEGENRGRDADRPPVAQTPAPAWSRLIWLPPQSGLIELRKRIEALGKDLFSRAKSTAQISTDARISDVHCKISRSDEDQDVYLYDLSSNGTYVNGALVGKDHRKTLRSGDTVTLLDPAKPNHYQFIFQDMRPPPPLVDAVKLTAAEAVAQATAEGLRLEPSSCASGYRGVFARSDSALFYARVRRDGKDVLLGSFPTAEEAALAVARATSTSRLQRNHVLYVAPEVLDEALSHNWMSGIDEADSPTPLRQLSSSSAALAAGEVSSGDRVPANETSDWEDDEVESPSRRRTAHLKRQRVQGLPFASNPQVLRPVPPQARGANAPNRQAPFPPHASKPRASKPAQFN